MKKFLLPLLFATACGSNPVNKAEVIALGQAPNAKCDSAITPKRHIHVTVCELANKTQVVAATSADHPFQAFPFETLEQRKAAEEAAAKKKAEATPPAEDPKPKK